jgi:polyhydroxyalkanoate synthesis regulator phasin
MVMPRQQNNAIITNGERMIMPHVAFDTLEFVKDLEEAGVEAKMAEAQAKAQVKILSNLVDRQVATKLDIQEVRTDINKIDVRIDKLEGRC